jgi:hypothetical protein
MQQKSQIPEADDKTTIQALIKGLTPGPTTSHLTRKKPKTIDELFHELKEYIMSDKDHRRRVAKRNEARQGNQEMTWKPQFQNPRISTTWKIPSLIRTIDQAQEEALHPGDGEREGEGEKEGEGEGEEDPRNSQTITQEIHTSTVNITEEVIAPKGAQKPRRTLLEFSKRAMMSIASTMPNQLRPSFWQPQFVNSQPNPVTMQQFQQPQPSWQPSQQFYPQSQAIQSIQ